MWNLQAIHSQSCLKWAGILKSHCKFSTFGELGQHSLQCNDVSDLKLLTSKQAYSHLGHSPSHVMDSPWCNMATMRYRMRHDALDVLNSDNHPVHCINVFIVQDVLLANFSHMKLKQGPTRHYTTVFDFILGEWGSHPSTKWYSRIPGQHKENSLTLTCHQTLHAGWCCRKWNITRLTSVTWAQCEPALICEQSAPKANWTMLMFSVLCQLC